MLFTQTSSAESDTAAINKLIVSAEKYQLSKPDSAIAIGKDIIRLSEQAGIELGLVRGHNITGMAYWAKADFNKGIRHLQTMVKLAEKLDSKPDMATAYGNLGILFIDMGDLEMGLQQSKKAVVLYEELEDEAGAALYNNNIGWIYEEQKKYDSALLYYNRAKQWYDDNDNENSWYGLLLSNIGSVYAGLNQPEQALEYTKRGLAIFTDSSNKKALGHIYLNLSEAYLVNHKHRSAVIYANMTLDIAEENALYTLYPDAHQLLYETYRDAGNTSAALKHLELNRVWTDTMLNDETYKQLTHIKTALATERKDKEIALKEKALAVSEALRQKNLFYLLMAILLAIFSIITGYQLYKRQKLRIKNKELQNKQLQKELDFKHRELLSYTLSMTEKNQMLQELNEQIEDIAQNGHAAEVRKIRNSINATMASEENWEEFRTRFEQVHYSFFDNLKKDYPQLSPNDLRLCAFIRLNLSSKQVASLLNIAPSSVDMSKYRLKKKLGLEKDDNISDITDKY